MRKALLAVLMFLTATSWGQASPTHLCEKELQVQSPSAIPLGFGQMLFFSHVHDSSGTVLITNVAQEPIKYYLILFELLDADGRHVVTVPTLNETSAHDIPFDVEFKPWLRANAVGDFEPIQPREKSRKPFFNQLTTLVCPVTAVVTLVQLEYDSGKKFTFVASKPAIPPLLLDPGMSKEDVLQKWTDTLAYITLEVGVHGQASLKKVISDRPDFDQWISGQVTHWKFSNAFEGSQSTAANLPVLLVIESPVDISKELRALNTREIGPNILVISMVAPDESVSGSWEFIVGQDIFRLKDRDGPGKRGRSESLSE